MLEISERKKEYDHHLFSFEIPTPFSIGTENAYLLLGDKLTLIDSGPKTEKAWKAFIYQLNENGFRIKDIEQIILTHQHVDHSGLLGMIKEYHPKVRIYTHPWTIPWVEKDPKFIQQKLIFFRELFSENGLSREQIQEIENFYSDLDQFMDPIKIDGILEDGMNLEGHLGWKVIHSPGHSLGHIVLYHEKRKILIAGDHIIGHTSAGAFVEPSIEQNEPRPQSVVAYQESLRDLRSLPLSRIYSGHGAVIDDPYEVIDNQLDRFERKKKQLEGFLVEGDFSVYELMKLTYPNRYYKHLALYFAEVIGHLDLLEIEGKVSTYKQGHIIKYHLEKSSSH
ncbi:MBL fold metallo-hydrolase [Tepidibacillus fermentans]|uniref:Glyoxylase-like metal-dependent hydrolase (Beta-lactamase superfamily II) n=1 Tax=Tepidibacillus fermentans TaxID=1281767 RepID=A0A4R3KF75_9BACI|nr:MBL fold metallo-hydrolase [Tepidibacillus fermentans]TCS81291.1 glyoxylase-like metal-dependent hydrolase (beta-lactamase superfamily II) [Tepidibacillus fermentans]